MSDERHAYMRDSVTKLLPQELKYHEGMLKGVRRRALKRRRAKLTLASAAAVSVVGMVFGVAVLSMTQPTGSADDSAVARDGGAAAEPAPWSDEVLDDGAGGASTMVLPGTAYVVAQGTTAAGNWVSASFRPDEKSHGCIMEVAGRVFPQPFGTCFDTWGAERPVQWDAWRGGPKSRYMLVLGAVGTDARSVRVTFADGTVDHAKATATPTTNDLRFFAVVAEASTDVQTVDALTSDGAPAAPPAGLPWTVDCTPSDPCPTRVD